MKGNTLPLLINGTIEDLEVYFHQPAKVRPGFHIQNENTVVIPNFFFKINGVNLDRVKYFSLIKLGIPDEKLRITYVSYKKANSKFEQAHMVLTYYHKIGVEPVVLDNIDKTLQVASKRTDLKPVYSFNASGLWQAKTKGEARVGNNELKSWKDLMSRF